MFPGVVAAIRRDYTRYQNPVTKVSDIFSNYQTSQKEILQQKIYVKKHETLLTRTKKEKGKLSKSVRFKATLRLLGGK